MERQKLRLFQTELARQCIFAVLAENDLKQSFNNMMTHESSDSISLKMNRFWYSAQALLVATANISKLLWPYTSSKFRTQEEGEELRKMLEIGDSSPLRDRGMRNHFEHFDERLAEYYKPGLNYHDTGIYGANSVQDNNALFLRIFDPDNFAITFCGETFALEPIMNAIRVLQEALYRQNPILRYL